MAASPIDVQIEDKVLTPPAVAIDDTRPKVLLLNDDGVKSKGLKELAIALEDTGYNVVVVSPMTNQIHPSFSVTIQETIRGKKLETWGKNILVFAVSGFPMNCLKFAYGEVIPQILKWKEIDLVIAGINKGRNIGTDLLYSGTIALASAARFENETFMKNNKTPKSMAISLCPPTMQSTSNLSSSQFLDWNFKNAVKATIQITKLLLKSEQTPNVLWNVNIPQKPKTSNNGNKDKYYWAVTKPCNLKTDPSKLITITKDDEKMSYKDFICNGPNEKYENIDGTDLNALNNNIISITPIELSPALHTPLHATNNLINLCMQNSEFMCDTKYFWNINVDIRPLIAILNCLKYWISIHDNDKDDSISLLQTYTLYLERDIKICASKKKFENLLCTKYGWNKKLEKFDNILIWEQLKDLYIDLSQFTNSSKSDIWNKMLKGGAMVGSVAALIYSIGFFKRSFDNKQ